MYREQMNDITKICKYLTFNMGKSYTFVDVQVTDEDGRDLPRVAMK